ncbi:M24 family metallopeptidase [Saccharospirillum salsuginis]|uniref:M24 family metallopeptidase n=1 Tax=Saccharospirillum salsuginis TaxID=418750 RepID=UPI001672E55B|nr:M24 family metallopeptidase [Saccharospirillum salsuginis]
MEQFEDYQHVQGIAKKVHSRLGRFITAESTEQSIARKAAELLADFGAPDTWYHDVPAFVLLGCRSCLSISGKDYISATEPVGEVNLVTVDLSPRIGNAWGDCARSYVVEEGIVAHYPARREFSEGLAIQRQLHNDMIEFATTDTRFSDLFEYGNARIRQYGYENLDFLQNLGHSIEIQPSDRRFIDRNCHEKLGSVRFFTFEPHIRKTGQNWGFKHEDIYYFDDHGCAVAL